MADETWADAGCAREIARQAISIEALRASMEEHYVRKETVDGMKTEIADLQQSRRTQTQALAGMLATIIAGLILFLLQRGLA